MTLSPEQKAVLIPLLGALSPGHLSTLAASLGEPESQIGTSRESAHFAFLRQLCEWGLAREVPLEIDLPPPLRARLTAVLIAEDAKAAIAELLHT